MVVHRFRSIVLCTKQLQHGVLDDTYRWTYQHVIAHVTEVDGAKLQTDLFGKQYNMTWVARTRGDYQADAVSFPKSGVTDDDLPKYPVIQPRKHAIRQGIYFADDREADTHGLEQ